VWTAERKLEAAIQAPIGPTGRTYVRDDTRIITRPGWHQVVTPSARTYLNEVLLSQLEEADTERVIDETIAMYRQLGVRLKWNVGPLTRPADLGERLRRRGFESVPLRGMGIDTAVSLAVDAPGVTVEEVDALGVDGFVHTMVSGWAMAQDQVDIEVRLHAALLARVPRVVHLFGAKVDGEWAGTAALALRDGYGYLVGGQVLAAARGRGAYRALLAARLAWLHARGFEYAVTHAHVATSAPVLAHLGFEALFDANTWSLEP
jgi:hypothetical protein